MSWDSAWSFSKKVLFFMIGLSILAGTVFCSLAVGGLVFAMSMQGGGSNGAAGFEGVAASIALYLACLAGRDRAMRALAPYLLLPAKEHGDAKDQ